MFLSTPPSRVATWEQEADKENTCSVSIHATLAGGDFAPLVLPDCIKHVSIHATLAGGDYSFALVDADTVKFLSTPPSRVATFLSAGQWRNIQVSIHATLAGGDELHRNSAYST